MPPTLVVDPVEKRLRVDEKQRVDLLGLVELLHKHLTETLCEEVFEQTRDSERQREWSLHALVWFWVAVTIRAPKALTHTLAQSGIGGDKLLPHVEATSEAFFQKCKDLRSDFFSKLYEALGPRLLNEAAEVYAQELSALREHFPEIWAMDGSQLAEVAHRLKILWKVHAAVLPGRVMAFYDLFRGINRAMCFEPDAAKNENLLAKEALTIVPEGTLILGDRLYGVPGYFEKLSQRKQWGLFRRNGTAKVEIVEVLSRKQDGRILLEDLLVRVGSGANGIPRQLVRLIRYRAGKKKLDLFTNVLNAEKLPADQAVKLYGMRWNIERMFFDLKEVLNLNRFYAANPNAIAMQVYAGVIVYNALRIVQGRIAQMHKIPPEMISPARLFPQAAAVAAKYATVEMTWDDTLRLNPGVKLNKPDYRASGFGTTTLGSILVRKKDKPRTKGKPNPAHVWETWRKVRGGAALLQKLS